MKPFDLCTVSSVVINLDRDTVKLEKFNKRFNKLGIFPQRFPAVNGKSLSLKDMIHEKLVDASVHYTIKNGRSTNSEISSMGGIGCYLSHVGIWQRLLKDPSTDMYMVYEDDCDVPDTSISNINNCVTNIFTNYPDWNVIYLGDLQILTGLGLFPQKPVDSKNFQIVDMIYGTHAYLINRQGASQLLKYAFPIVFQVDSYMSYQYANQSVIAYRPYTKSFMKQLLPTSSSVQTDSLSNVRTLVNWFPNKWIWIFLIIFLVCFGVTIVTVVQKLRKIKNK